jgi:hypothetical protein
MKKINLFAITLALLFNRTGTFAADASASTNTPEATTYQIRNVKHQELLRPRDANNATGTPIVLYPAQPWKCMTWRLQPAAGESAFHLKNLFTGKTFSASGDTNAPTLFVKQIPLAKDDGESPAWLFTKLDDGSYKITDRKSGKVLTAKKSEGEYEVKITLAPLENLAEQKWILEKMDPKQLTM